MIHHGLTHKLGRGRSVVQAVIAEENAVTIATIALRTTPPGPIRPDQLTIPVRSPIVGIGASWMDLRNCLNVPPDIFYPERGQSAEPAKAICAECKVRAKCLTWALERNETMGIWGGASERERRRMRRVLPRWARCRACEQRFLKTAPGHLYCRSDHCVISPRWRRDRRRDVAS